jgi:hypothetical protein
MVEPGGKKIVVSCSKKALWHITIYVQYRACTLVIMVQQFGANLLKNLNKKKVININQQDHHQIGPNIILQQCNLRRNRRIGREKVLTRGR